LVFYIKPWAAHDSPLWVALEPKAIGRQFAGLVARGGRIAAEAAHLLASTWPELESDGEEKSAGEALLARAGAVEASERIDPNVTADAQVAEVPPSTNLR
jgi:hypothetical protein